MNDNPKNVFTELNEIKEQNTQMSEKIAELMESIQVNQQQMTQNNQLNNVSYKPRLSPKEALAIFVKKSKKFYLHCGGKKFLEKDKKNYLIVCLIFFGISLLSTIATTIAAGLYSTFTLLENIWTIMVIVTLVKSRNYKTKLQDIEYKELSTEIFKQNADGTWYPIKEKKKYKFFRVITYISAICNIIYLIGFVKSGGIFAIIMEASLFAAVIVVRVFWSNIIDSYGSFIMYEGLNLEGTEKVTLVHDLISRRIVELSEFKQKFFFMFE